MAPLITVFTEKLGMEIQHFEKLSAEMRTRVLKKKEHLIREGSVCNFICLVSSGTLRSYIRNNGDEFNNDFYFKNSFVSAYTSYLTQMPTNCTYRH